LILELRDISKRYKNVQAVKDATFDLKPGEALVIEGPSGSGKTTLLRLIAGLEIPDGGEIHIDGALASKPGWVASPNSRGLGFVFQQPTLWPHMTLYQNIAFAVHQRPETKRRAIVFDLLEKMGLSDHANRYPDEVSGGEARRVELARALAVRPRLLLMDEPMVHLDPELKTDLIRKVLEFTAQGSIALIYVTHDTTEAQQISTRRLRMSGGRLGEV
jgi:iron(III) transport system ATP-binding protein